MTVDRFLFYIEKAFQAKTAYMWGTFGIKITNSLISQKKKQYYDRYSSARVSELKAKADGKHWAWDCVGLIKGILWGWTGDESLPYGGAVYVSNNVPDVSVDGMKRYCDELSSDFTKIRPGELLFMQNHIGVYIGDGVVAEATLGDFGDGVVKTRLAGRGWTHHGKCHFLEYEKEGEEMSTFVHVEKIGLYVRNSLSFKKNKANGKVLAFCPVGKEMEITEFVPGIQPDGYQWVKTRYNGIDGYSQYDSKCYYIYKK